MGPTRKDLVQQPCVNGWCEVGRRGRSLGQDQNNGLNCRDHVDTGPTLAPQLSSSQQDCVLGQAEAIVRYLVLGV